MSRPFSNGDEYRAWKRRNCEGCGRWGCAVLDAVIMAYMGDGTVADNVAQVIGWARTTYEAAITLPEMSVDPTHDLTRNVGRPNP